MINVIRPGTALLFTLLAADPALAQRIDLVDDGATRRRLGPQLRSSRVDCMARMEAQRRNETVPPQPEGSKACGLKGGAGVLDLGGMPMSALAQALSGPAGRQVVDKTGLTGSFDAELQYAPATGTRGPTDPAPPGSDGASLFTAVQEQLGLRLEPSKTSIDVLVIDYIERPTPD